jgi:hypothetical protein
MIPSGPMRAAPVSLDEVVAHEGAQKAWIVAPNLARAREALAKFPHLSRIELELEDPTGIEATLDGRRVDRVVVREAAHAEALLAIDAEFEVVLDLSQRNEAWLLALTSAPARLVLRQPTYERLTEALEQDIDLRAFFARFTHPVPLENVPACISGRAPRSRPEVLDTAMMKDGRVEIFRYARRYLLEHYRTKSLRCKQCIHDTACDGMHINYVRAHGYAVLDPITAPSSAAAE